MPEQIDLKSIERRAYLSMFEDGLLDLFIGTLFLMSVARSGLDLLDTAPAVPYMSYALLLLGFAIYVWGKRLITIPRLGMVTFGQRRQQRRRGVIVIFAAALLIPAAALIIGPRAAGLAQQIIPLMIIAVLFIPLALAAYLLEVKRFYLYAVLFTLPEILIQLTGMRLVFIVALLAAAVIALTLGGVLLARFMRKYPAPTNSVVSDGG